MSDIYLYAADETDFDNIGICGALMPSECRFSEIANGNSILTLTHPRDEYGKFALIERGMIIKADVPVRTTPEITNGQYVTTVYEYTVLSTATKEQRKIWNCKDKTKEKRKSLKVAGKGDKIIVVKTFSNANYFSKVKYTYNAKGKNGKAEKKTVTGFIDPAAISSPVARTIPGTPDGMDSVADSWAVKEQLFRIENVEKTEGEVNVTAHHISYDLMYNLTSYDENGEKTLDQALQGVLDGCFEGHNFEAQTNIQASLTGFHFADKDPITALLDPEIGLVKRFDGELVRDNYMFTILDRAGTNRGYRIEYGKNMTGISWQIDESSIAGAIRPTGEDKNGNKFYLSHSWIANDDYTQLTQVSGDDKGLVYSPRYYTYSNGTLANTLPYTRIYALTCDNCKCTVDDSDTPEASDVTPAVVRARMKDQALKALKEGADVPDVCISVDIKQLGRSEQYADFADLEKVFLFDTVLVYHRNMGILADAVVSAIEWDCIMDELTGITLGTVLDLSQSIASWQIVTINGGKIMPSTIPGTAIQPGTISAEHIAAHTITADEIMAGTITADKLVADQGEFTSLITRDAVIGSANIEEAAIGNAHIQNGTIENAKIKDGTIENAKIHDLDAGKINAGYLSADRIKAGSLNADKIKAGTIEADRLKAGLITAESGLLANGCIGTAHIGELSATDASIFNISADVIKVGTLSAERLLLRGDDGLFYRMNVVAGNLTPQQLTDNQYKNYLSGTTLVAQSVTADKIAARTIMGNNLLTNTITAQELNIANIFGDQATINAINAMDITSNTYLNLMVNNLQVGAVNQVDLTSWGWGGASGGDISGNNVLTNTDVYDYCRSKRVFRMSGAYTGNYNILAFNNIILSEQQTCTLTFWTRIADMSGGYPTLRIDIYNSTNNQYVDYGGITYTAENAVYRKYTFRFIVNASGTYSLRFISLNSDRNGWNGGSVNFSDVMLVEGQYAVPYAPNPNEVQARLASAEINLTDSHIVMAVRNSSDYQSDLSGKASTQSVTNVQAQINLVPNQITQAVGEISVGGDNLIRYADGKVTMRSGYINSFETDTFYRRGGKEFRLTPFTGTAYSYAQFLSAAPMWANSKYTISFTAWAYQVTGTVPDLSVSILGTDDGGGTINIARTATLTAAPKRFAYTFTSTQTANTDGMRVLFSIASTFTGTFIGITDVKLESGEKATDWTPHREEMRAGSTVVINQDEVAISTPEFSIDIGSNGNKTVTITQDEVAIATPAFSIDIGTDGNKDVQIDETGATFRTLIAPNKAERYEGPAAISVPTDGSLKTVLETLNRRILDYDVTITLTNDDTSSGAIQLLGVTGYGQITVKGPITGQTATGGRVIKQPLYVTSCGVRVVFEDLTFTYQGGTQATGTTDTFLRFTRCLFNSGLGTSIMVVLNNGTNCTLYQCQLVNKRSNGGATLMQANFNCDLLIHSCKGGTSGYFLSSNGASVKAYSSRPYGNWARAAASLTAPSDLTTVTVDSTGYSGTPVPDPPADPTTTTYNTASSGDWTGGSWNANYLRQGILNGNSYVACLWFGLSGISSRTIQSASLTLKRNAAGPDSSNVRLKTISQTAAAHTGNPNSYVINDYGKIGVTRRQKTVEIDIPAAAISDIKANGGGLMLYVNDSEQMSGKTYSANYASYDSASLSVTYT